MNQVHEFLACLGLIEGTAEVAGGGDAVLLLHTTHLHTHVASLYDNHHAEGMECLFDALLNLECHALLHLQTMTVDIDYAGYLRLRGLSSKVP